MEAFEDFVTTFLTGATELAIALAALFAVCGLVSAFLYTVFNFRKLVQVTKNIGFALLVTILVLGVVFVLDAGVLTLYNNFVLKG